MTENEILKQLKEYYYCQNGKINKIHSVANYLDDNIDSIKKDNVDLYNKAIERFLCYGVK